MGNYRFRLSDMIPNSWFYKLRDRSRATTAAAGRRSTTSRKKDHHPSIVPRAPPFHPQPPVKPGRASYYIPSCSEDKASDTKFLLDPPRKSKKKHREGRSVVKPSAKIVTSSKSSGCACRTTLGSAWRPECPLVPERDDDDDDDDDDDSNNNNNDDDDSGNGNTNDDLDWLPCLDKTVIACNNCRVTSSATDIIIDIDEPKSREPGKTTGEFHLPPILTRPTKKEPCPVPKLEQKSPRRRSSAGVQGKRMRANSPRLASKKMQAHRSRKSSALAPTPRRGLSGSFAVVKSSSNPRRDFRDSMMEMIVENNIRAATDLEELLACYLSLNSNEYHDVIVKVFEQIWFDLTNIKL